MGDKTGRFLNERTIFFFFSGSLLSICCVALSNRSSWSDLFCLCVCPCECLSHVGGQKVGPEHGVRLILELKLLWNKLKHVSCVCLFLCLEWHFSDAHSYYLLSYKYQSDPSYVNKERKG